MGIIGERLTIAGAINNSDDVARSAKVQLYHASGGAYELLDAADNVSIAANSSADVAMEWDTGGYGVGVHMLIFSVLSVDEAETFATAVINVELVPSGVVFVLVREGEHNLGNIVGSVSKPQVVTAPIYPPTPTYTSTPTQTARHAYADAYTNRYSNTHAYADRDAHGDSGSQCGRRDRQYCERTGRTGDAGSVG